MRYIIAIIMISSLVIGAFTSHSRAELVTMDEALRMSQNWITQTLHRKGTWGESETAQIEHIQEFKRGDRVLGYCCSVKPTGFIVISLLKGLAPIKAYSTTSDLDPNSDEGLEDLLKLKTGQILTGIERQLGRLESVITEDLLRISDIDYLPIWERLDVDPGEFRPWDEPNVLKLGSSGVGYQPGTFLLRSSWHQKDPYNTLCPNGHEGCTAAHCSVGCVATAGAQILRHWCWPPYSSLDWPDMPQRLSAGSLQQEIHATSLLCYLVGTWVDMDWCYDEDKPCSSAADTGDMEEVFEDHGYSDCEVVPRVLTETSTWWNRIKNQINLNRPIQYSIESHSIVCDGWDYWYMVHMNYGWEDINKNNWYSIDGLYHGDGPGEFMVKNIVPNVSVGSILFGSYNSPLSPYYYFDQDCIGGPATFYGHHIQLLHDIKIICIKEYIKFIGLSDREVRLFTRGDMTRGIRIGDGALKLLPGGSFKIHPAHY